MILSSASDTMPALKLQDPSRQQHQKLPSINVKNTDMDSNSESQHDSEMGGVTTTKEIRQMDTINEIGENEDEAAHSSGSDGGDIVMFVESKYCTVCHLEQPLRAKHCKSCDQCVATHDHHCPWIGNCVGERNKARFYYFLCI